MHRNLLGALVPIAAALLALTACGSGSSSAGGASGGSSKDSSGSSSTKAPEARTITPQKTCDKVNPAAAARALGVRALKVTADVAPGEAYEPVPGQKVPATSFLCKLESPGVATPRGYLSVSMKYADPSLPLKQDIDERYKQWKTDGGDCTRAPAEGWGKSGEVLSCTFAKDTVPEVFTAYGADFDKTRIYCTAGVRWYKKANVSKASSTAEEICNDLLDKVSS